MVSPIYVHKNEGCAEINKQKNSYRLLLNGGGGSDTLQYLLDFLLSIGLLCTIATTTKSQSFTTPMDGWACTNLKNNNNNKNKKQVLVSIITNCITSMNSAIASQTLN